MPGAPQNMPWWIDPLLLTVCNLALAFAFSALLVWFIGESPPAIAAELLRGAFGSAEAVGYTLFYATNFIFTGLAVAVAYHCGLFNIGGEGQAYIGGLGLGQRAYQARLHVAGDAGVCRQHPPADGA